MYSQWMHTNLQLHHKVFAYSFYHSFCFFFFFLPLSLSLSSLSVWQGVSFPSFHRVSSTVTKSDTQTHTHTPPHPLSLSLTLSLMRLMMSCRNSNSNSSGSRRSNRRLLLLIISSSDANAARSINSVTKNIGRWRAAIFSQRTKDRPKGRICQHAQPEEPQGGRRFANPARRSGWRAQDQPVSTPEAKGAGNNNYKALILRY